MKLFCDILTALVVLTVFLLLHPFAKRVFKPAEPGIVEIIGRLAASLTSPETGLGKLLPELLPGKFLVGKSVNNLLVAAD